MNRKDQNNVSSSLSSALFDFYCPTLFIDKDTADDDDSSNACSSCEEDYSGQTWLLYFLLLNTTFEITNSNMYVIVTMYAVFAWLQMFLLLLTYGLSITRSNHC